MRTIQIPEELFWDLCRFHLLDLEADEAGDVAQIIQDGLTAKLKALQRRTIYTISKDTRSSPEAREAARQAYLNMVGMLPDFRWDSRYPEE